MLTESNNVIAENLARQVAIATGRPASFSGAAAAETAVLRRLGIRGRSSLVDGSGLSPLDRITPDVLVQLIRLAAAPGQPGLRPVLTGLPVAGFSGTLAPGGSVFPDVGQAGLGVVRAKTGNLLTVVSLAGVAQARDGQLLAFAFMADQLPKTGLDAGAAGPDQAGHDPGGLRLPLSAVRAAGMLTMRSPATRPANVRWRGEQLSDDRLECRHVNRGQVGTARARRQHVRGQEGGRGAAQARGHGAGPGPRGDRAAWLG